MKSTRLGQQINFLLEIDRLKSIIRRTYLVNDPRHENSAEHSWHLAMMAIILVEHSNESLDILKVLKLLLVHDIVEIDAGDTYCYDITENQNKHERERAAAERIFGILPKDQSDEVWALWNEFEGRLTPEAKFAAGLDRVMPILHNFSTEGRAWVEHGITRTQVYDRNKHTAEGSEALWEMVESIIRDSVKLGYLRDE